MTEKKLGMKFDQQKTQWHLLPFREVEEVVEVLMYGAKKYLPFNWEHVNPKRRYFNACLRHVLARLRGERFDKESGKTHLSHAACCLLFLMWADNEKIDWDKENNEVPSK